jgi:psiF repeat
MLQRTCSWLLAALLLGALTAPGSALTAEEKMETCKFGADSQKLTGAKRKTFIAKCMAEESAPARRPKPQ